LTSLAEQTEPPDEVIGVTDGPLGEEDEGRYEALLGRQPFGAAKCKFLRQPHRCLGAGYNAAAQEASSDVLYFMRAGQHLAKSNLVETLRRVFGTFRGDACSSFFEAIPMSTDRRTKTVRVLPLGGDPCAHALSQAVLGGKAFAVRREALAALEGFEAVYHVEGVEEELLARLMLAGRELQVIPEVLYEDAPERSKVSYNDVSGKYLTLKPYIESAPLHFRRLLSYTRHSAFFGTETANFSSKQQAYVRLPKTWFVEVPDPEHRRTWRPRMKIALDPTQGLFHVAAEACRFAETPDRRLEIFLDGWPLETLELRPLNDRFHGTVWRYLPPTARRSRQRFRFAIESGGMAREFIVRLISADTITVRGFGGPFQELEEIYGTGDQGAGSSDAGPMKGRSNKGRISWGWRPLQRRLGQK
jgi:hypothetical protein